MYTRYTGYTGYIWYTEYILYTESIKIGIIFGLPNSGPGWERDSGGQFVWFSLVCVNE